MLKNFPPSLPPLSQTMLTYPRLRNSRFHVPGHNGNPFVFQEAEGVSAILKDPYAYDLTELEGLDVLSEPEGCIDQSQKEIAQLFGVAHSFFLVNGSSAGLVAALLAAFSPGDRVLVPRNAHRSIMSGLILAGLTPVWFSPEWLPDWGLFGGVTLQHLEPYLNDLTHPAIKGVVITSPTYEGIASPVASLTTFCRDRNLISIVDEAHGGLFPFHTDLPPSACYTQADCVVQSIHKTGGSLTQTAIAHLPSGSQIDPHRFQQALNMMQTTSPSYLLLSSLENSCFYLASNSGQKRIYQLLENVHGLRTALHEKLQRFKLFSPEDLAPCYQLDPARLYLKTPHIVGADWAVQLETKAELSYESTHGFGALYIAGLGLEKVDYEWFLKIFQQADVHLMPEPSTQAWVHSFPFELLPEMAVSPREAYFAAGHRIPLSEAQGRIAKETFVHCPPGIPILFPGEVIQKEHLPFLPETLSVLLSV